MGTERVMVRAVSQTMTTCSSWTKIRIVLNMINGSHVCLVEQLAVQSQHLVSPTHFPTHLKMAEAEAYEEIVRGSLKLKGIGSLGMKK